MMEKVNKAKPENIPIRYLFSIIQFFFVYIDNVCCEKTKVSSLICNLKSALNAKTHSKRICLLNWKVTRYAFAE